MKLLLAVEASADSTRIARHIAGHFKRDAVEVHVLCVVPPASREHESAAGAEFPAELALRRAKALVETLASELRDRHGIVVASAETDCGDPATRILAASHRTGSDLILLQAEPPRAGALFGAAGISKRVMAEARCGVELIRKPQEAQEDLPTSAPKVVLALTRADMQRFPLHAICNRPWPAGTRLHLVCATQAVASATRLETSPYTLLRAIGAARAARVVAERQIDALAAELQRRLGADVRVTAAGCDLDDERDIVDAATRQQPSLLILLGAAAGARGRWPGSLQNRIQRAALRADASVLVLKEAARAQPIVDLETADYRSPAVNAM